MSTLLPWLQIESKRTIASPEWALSSVCQLGQISGLLLPWSSLSQASGTVAGLDGDYSTRYSDYDTPPINWRNTISNNCHVYVLATSLLFCRSQ